MKRLVVATFLALTLAAIAPHAQAAQPGNLYPDGMHNVSYNEQTAMEQLMGVLNGASFRQAERTSNETLKEFTDWRNKMEASVTPSVPAAKKQPAANTGARRMPPNFSRRAY